MKYKNQEFAAFLYINYILYVVLCQSPIESLPFVVSVLPSFYTSRLVYPFPFAYLNLLLAVILHILTPFGLFFESRRHLAY